MAFYPGYAFGIRIKGVLGAGICAAFVLCVYKKPVGGFFAPFVGNFWGVAVVENY